MQIGLDCWAVVLLDLWEQLQNLAGEVGIIDDHREINLPEGNGKGSNHALVDKDLVAIQFSNSGGENLIL